MSDTCKVFDNLHMQWMWIWMRPNIITATLVDQALGIHLEIWVTPGQQMMVKCGDWGCKPKQDWSQHINVRHMQGVWQPSYAVDVNMDVSLLLEESARANPDARIRPLTHVSVNRAYQAESVGSNSLGIILIAIRRSPNLWVKISGEIVSFKISRKICFNLKKRISSQDMVCPWTYHNCINPNTLLCRSSHQTTVAYSYGLQCRLLLNGANRSLLS